ncbi:MAG: response regulator [Bacteroidia bacterium]|nr:response regulator [Bacteroidia bacterium]
MNQAKPVLLVEDNPADEKLALLAFRKLGIPYQIEVARDGEEALDYLFGNERKSGSKPYPIIIIMDLRLPKVDGLEILAKIRENPETQMIPVIVFTTSSDAGDIRNSYLSGANSFISKPVDLDEFDELIEMTMTYWLEYNQYPL